MNIMLVSVTQRTREIGVRLAVGATEWDVQLQFLSEAVALSALGGLLGILTGVFSSAVVQQFFQFPTKLTPEVLAIGGLFAASIGIVFGYYPARKASQRGFGGVPGQVGHAHQHNLSRIHVLHAAT